MIDEALLRPGRLEVQMEIGVCVGCVCVCVCVCVVCVVSLYNISNYTQSDLIVT